MVFYSQQYHSLGALKQDVISTLTKEQESIQLSIDQTDHNLSDQKHKLESIKTQLNTLDQRSGWSKFKGVISRDHSQKILEIDRQATETLIKESSNKLSSLHDKKRHM